MSGGRVYYKFPSMKSFEAISVFEDTISVRDLSKRVVVKHQLKEGVKLQLTNLEGGKVFESHEQVKVGTQVDIRAYNEYTVRGRAPTASSTEDSKGDGTFLATFPSGAPPLKSYRRWEMASMEEQARGYGAVKRRKWLLREGKGKLSYQGLEEGVGSSRYCVLALAGDEFRAVPVDKWFRFAQESASTALTLEEAEAEMAKRKNLKKGYQRWMLRSNESDKAAASEDDLSEVENDADEDEERKKRATAGGEGSTSAVDKKSNPSIKKIKKKEEVDEEEDREDWEHEEAASDDEEGVGANPFEKEEQEPVAPKTLKEEEDNEEKRKLNETGKEWKRLLGKGSFSDSSEDDEEDDENEDEGGEAKKKEDEGKKDMGSNVKAEVNQQVKKETSAAAAPESKPAAVPVDASGKRKREQGDQDQAPSIKREKTEDPKTNGAKPDAPTATYTYPISPAERPKQCEQEVRNILRRVGPMTTKDLIDKIRERVKLANSADKQQFSSILKTIAVIKPDAKSGKKMVHLK